MKKMSKTAFMRELKQGNKDFRNVRVENLQIIVKICSKLISDLSGAIILNSDFSNANLKRATLIGANLENSNFNEADLTEARLNFANIKEDAVLDFAELRS